MPITFQPAVRESASARITVTEPIEDDLVTSTDGKFTFNAAIQNFDIGADQFPSDGTPPCAIDPNGGRGGGQHILLIVDNDQAFKIYQLPDTISLNPSSPGTHTLRAYLSRSWEESVKGSVEDIHFSTRTFSLNARSGDAGINRATPLLACSAPLESDIDGPYRYDHVILDFFVMFGDVGSNCAVHATLKDVDGIQMAQAILTTWQTHCIIGLPQPEPDATDVYHLTLRLVDSGGVPIAHIAGGYDLNTIERTFHVVRDLPGIP
ncbi:MAG: hypothetical protein JST22_03975 [Bacteroidetes bacterium]|nr:hypothetical protein [Bacteroidota bacterium]